MSSTSAPRGENAENAIRRCLARYCRGIDRRDRAMLDSVYWPDSYDDHITYQGSGPGFIEWVYPNLPFYDLTQHMLGQSLIEIEGDGAAVETHFFAFHRLNSEGQLSDVWLGGRYVDRFECRDGEWRIAFRRVIGDWHRTMPSEGGFDKFALGGFPPSNTGSPENDPSVALLGGNWI